MRLQQCEVRGRNGSRMSPETLAKVRFPRVCGSWVLSVTLPGVAGRMWAGLVPVFRPLQAMEPWQYAASGSSSTPLSSRLPF